MWPFMDQREEVVDGRGGSDLGVSMASLSGHVCPLPPSARHKHRDKGMQTHTVSCHVSNLGTS